MRKCYIVQGDTGEYSDRTDWTVRVFLSEEKARAFTEALLEHVRGSSEWDSEKQHAFEHPLDPKCRMQYTGTDYTYLSRHGG